MREETARGNWALEAYLKEITAPLARGFPLLTRQSLLPSFLNIKGLISSSDAKESQLRWIWAMLQSLGHSFIICTLKIGVPLGRLPVVPCMI